MLREYSKRHGIAWGDMSGENCDAYLRSIGAVPVAEMCARTEALELAGDGLERLVDNCLRDVHCHGCVLDPEKCGRSRAKVAWQQAKAS